MRKTRNELLLFIVLLLLLASNALSIASLDSGTCISLPNGTNVCATKYVCSTLQQNVTLSCPQQICNPVIPACGPPVINAINNINNTFVQQPVISRYFLQENQNILLLITGVIILIIAFRMGWLNKLKEIKMPKIGRNYMPPPYNYPQYPQAVKQPAGRFDRDMKDEPTDFKELK